MSVLEIGLMIAIVIGVLISWRVVHTEACLAQLNQSVAAKDALLRLLKLNQERDYHILQEKDVEIQEKDVEIQRLRIQIGKFAIGRNSEADVNSFVDESTDVNIFVDESTGEAEKQKQKQK